MGSLVDKLHQLNCTSGLNEQAVMASKEEMALNVWHERLGHLNEQQQKDAVRNNVA